MVNQDKTNKKREKKLGYMLDLRISIVDPDPVESRTFWKGRIWIRNNSTGSGSELLFDKKICLVFKFFFKMDKYLVCAL